MKRGQRFTIKGEKKNEREAALTKRIVTALRRHGFKARDATQYLDGIRSNGINVETRCDAYIVRLAIVLPGRAPDYRQREALASHPCAIAVCSVADALRAVSVGILA